MKGKIALLCLIVFLTAGCLGEGASLANWPHGYKSAVVIGFEVEQAQSSDINKAVQILKSHEANGTFFVVAGYYQNVPEVLEDLHGFEVASKGWNQTEWTMSYEDQRKSVKRSQDWFEDAGFETVGFRAPFLKSDKETTAVLSDLGYRYDSSKVGQLPSRYNGITELPLSVSYDPFWNKDVEEYLPLLYLTFENTYSRDGLFVFYTYPEHIDEKYGAFLDHISGKNVWLASGGEIVEWWEKREKMSVKIEGDTAIITNNGLDTVSGATLKTRNRYTPIPDVRPGSTIRVRI
jgi:hypothetical protein